MLLAGSSGSCRGRGGKPPSISCRAGGIPVLPASSSWNSATVLLGSTSAATGWVLVRLPSCWACAVPTEALTQCGLATGAPYSQHHGAQVVQIKCEGNAAPLRKEGVQRF